MFSKKSFLFARYIKALSIHVHYMWLAKSANKWVERMAVSGALGPLAGRIWEIGNSLGQGNFTFVRKKSGNFKNLWLRQPCQCYVYVWCLPCFITSLLHWLWSKIVCAQATKKQYMRRPLWMGRRVLSLYFRKSDFSSRENSWIKTQPLFKLKYLFDELVSLNMNACHIVCSLLTLSTTYKTGTILNHLTYLKY